ncbi:hypothetical protein D3C73_567850 [compost metagenome]
MKTIEVGPFEYLVIFHTIDIEVLFHHDLVQGQCTCFIRTENIHCTDILNGIQAFDNDLTFTHINSSFG